MSSSHAGITVTYHRGRHYAPRAVIDLTPKAHGRIIGWGGGDVWFNPIDRHGAHQLIMCQPRPSMALRDWRDDPLEALDASHEDRNGRMPHEAGWEG